jgi:soluble cytochrome b562
MTLQVVSPKSLRKLKARIEEIPEVKAFVETAKEGLPTGNLQELLSQKKVKENQDMTALLMEIDSYLTVGNFDAAKAAAKRVLDVEFAPVTAKPNERRVRTEPDLVLSVPTEDQGQPTVEKLE